MERQGDASYKVEHLIMNVEEEEEETEDTSTNLMTEDGPPVASMLFEALGSIWACWEQ